MALTWESTPPDFVNATTAEITTRCNQIPTVSGQCASIKRVAERVVVKIGLTLEESEFQNQSFAWSLLLPTKVRVPQPYRFFRAENCHGIELGYLVMEYIHGKSLACEGLLLDERLIDLVASAIHLLHTRSAFCLDKHTPPGPIFGGLASGFPWGEGKADLYLRSAEDLEHALNSRLVRWRSTKSRLKAQAGPLSLERSQFAICHMDLAPRNFMLASDGKITILDWSTMGHYPTLFELAGLVYLQRLVEPPETFYLEKLQARMQSWIPYDADSVEKLEYVQQCSIRFN